jgi:hypothetical protein
MASRRSGISMTESAAMGMVTKPMIGMASRLPSTA